MNVTHPTATNPLEQLNKVKPASVQPQKSNEEFAAILNSEVSLNNGGGGHPLNPKVKPK